jgi:predicted Zn-dependent peptidase
MDERTRSNMHIPVTKHRLDNGLTVLLVEDHRLPQAAVNLWYHVGSKDEAPGKTGFAHLFEHMMFQGSEHYPQDFFKPLEEVGARLNGSTAEDRTNYWEVVPSAYLERALWLESDRMGFLLPAMDQAKLDNQREVVKNERRQTVENEPYGVAEEAILEALYPAGHPYRHPIIGSMADIDAATLEDVQAFFRRYYTPSNASLCIAGDMDPKTALALAETYFGAIPAGPVVPPVQPFVPDLQRPIRAGLEDNVRLPRLYLQWPSAVQFTNEAAALSVLGYVLATGKDSRLVRRLQVDHSAAQSVWAFQSSKEVSGAFSVIATAQQDRSLDELEHAIWEELDRLAREGVREEEVRAAVDAIRASLVRRLQSLGGFGGVSDLVNRYQTFTGDPAYLPKDLARFEAVTAEAVSEVSRRCLAPNRCVALSVVPRRTQPFVVADRSSIPGPGPEGAFALPTPERLTLASGMSLWVCPQRALPLVTAALFVRAGSVFDPAELPGLAELTLDMLDESVAGQGPLDLARRQKALATSLADSQDSDYATLSLSLLTEHVQGGLALLADVVSRPDLRAEDLERLRKDHLSDLQRRMDDAPQLGEWALKSAIFGDRGAYGHPSEGTPASLNAAGLEDVRKLFAACYSPSRGCLVIVGDTSVDEALRMAEDCFGSWRSGAAGTAPDLDSEGLPPGLYLVDKPEAPQAFIAAGQVALERSDPRYPAFLVFNAVFGGQFTSRLNMNLREEKGYTYGARSYVDLQRGPMPWVLSAAVQADKTMECLAEARREIDQILTARPVTAEEFEKARAGIVLRYPQSFETQAQLAQGFGSLWVHGLPADYHEKILARLRGLTLEEVQEAGRQILDPSALRWVVVGHSAGLESTLEGAGLGAPRRLGLPG